MARFELSSETLVAMVPSSANGEAYYELGMMYSTGRTVPINLIEAHKWFNIAVMRGYKPAVERRAELAQEMASSDVAQAQREARLWLTRH